jgi:hypothetical protein
MSQSPLGSWQEKNWDPKVGSTTFDQFCESLAKPPYASVDDSAFLDDAHHDENRLLEAFIDFTVLNYAEYIREVILPLSRCV